MYKTFYDLIILAAFLKAWTDSHGRTGRVWSVYFAYQYLYDKTYYTGIVVPVGSDYINTPYFDL